MEEQSLLHWWVCQDLQCVHSLKLLQLRLSKLVPMQYAVAAHLKAPKAYDIIGHPYIIHVIGSVALAILTALFTVSLISVRATVFLHLLV